MAEMEVNMASQVGLERHLDDDLINYDSDTEKLLIHEETTDAVYGAEEVVLGKMSTKTAGEDDAPDEVDFFESGEQDETESPRLESGTTGEGHDASRQASHEIDYDFDEPTQDDTPVAINDDEKRTASEQRQSEEETVHGEEVQGLGDPNRKADDHEISWEQEDDPVEAGSQDHETTASNGQHMSPNQPSNSETEHQVASGLNDGGAAEAEDSQSEELEAAGDEIGDDADLQDDGDQDLLVDLECSDVDENDVPAITVQYRGDEFPFFSLSSEGFFSQLSVLDYSLKSVLSGLRDELANELLPEDDLVFQVDELGLEFAESSPPEFLCNISLRQILEVFDILVKNQDPESSRPLYTYLFTRPSAGRRFDFLMESATEGKGLDEVIHLFQPPVPRTTGLRDISAGENLSSHSDDDHSSLEDHTAQGVGDTLSGQATGGKTSERLVDEDSLSDQEGSTARDYGDDGPANELEDLVPPYGNAMREPAEVSPLFDEAVASGALAPEDDVGDGEVDEDQVPEGGSQDPGDEVHDLIDPDFDETLELADSDVAGAVGQSTQDYLEDANAKPCATDASTTTTTLKDDGEELAALDAMIDQAAVGDLIEQDDGAQIDWGDDAEPRLQDEVAGDESSSAGKRARGDDGFGSEDNQNVKRQRSD
ncbi:uncharacterized protein MAM_01598 [Metarhizium album ARSEF 1941]|uniref:Uncharacterized protein n=1 Tax=Metarhizium album (strain ARSEF 1941) TaxID=1081103 RepID=A0A0B2X5V4_METAS|nr:uncharacterized protein MAM_01598 [Metarhizium album ARSEF 1941]KHO00820.1 hypothetical protein MAM_01598 [Metarhizium album ARSEF 1941]